MICFSLAAIIYEVLPLPVLDQEILQLIREAKCLDRMGIEIPESAKIVLLQEDKFKSYFNDLQVSIAS